MADYIDREKLLEDLERFAPECRAAFLIIEKQEAVKAVPAVHGRWVWAETGEEDYEQYWVCSKCGEHTYFITNYCSNCGAKMDLEVKYA